MKRACCIQASHIPLETEPNNRQKSSLVKDVDPVGQRIRQARIELGLTIDELAAEVNVVRETMNRYELGTLTVSLDLVRRVAKVTGKPASWFLEEDDDVAVTATDNVDIRESVGELKRLIRNLSGAIARTPRQAKQPALAATIPLLAEVPAGRPRDATTTSDETIVVPSHWIRGGFDVYGLRVRGDSMEPSILDGDIVIVRAATQPEIGQIVVVQMEDSAPEGTSTVKRFVRSRSGQPMLKGDNPAWRPKPIPPGSSIAGVVIALLRVIS